MAEAGRAAHERPCAAARGDTRGSGRRGPAHVPRLPELRRDPRLQLRALLRADCCPVVGPLEINRSPVSSPQSTVRACLRPVVRFTAYAKTEDRRPRTVDRGP